MATYYFSEANGNDTRNSTQAQSSSTPWKTTAKLQGFSINAGDTILFERGGKYGADMTSYNLIPMTLAINGWAGSSGSKITVGAYGSGADPIFTSLKSTTSPTDMEGSGYPNVWSYSVSTWNEISIVYLDGTLKPVARSPKRIETGQRGYLMGKTKSGGGQGASATITTSSANVPAANIVGADLVTKANHYIVVAHKITGKTSTTVTFDNMSAAAIEDQYGFFYQNHISFLTENGDWAYDRTNGKLYVYWADDTPANHTVEYASTNYLIWLLNGSYIDFNNIHFKGVNVHGVKPQGSDHVTFTSCSFTAMGRLGIWQINGSASYTIDGCTFTDCYAGAVDLGAEANCTVKNSTLTRISNVLGAHRWTWNLVDNGGGKINDFADGTNGAGAIIVNGNNGLIDYNKINYCGYNGIVFNGQSTQVVHNYIYRSCTNTMDGASIYTYGTNVDQSQFNSGNKRIVQYNICISADGDPGGTPDLTYRPTYGIYMDDETTYVDILNNTISEAEDAAIYLHHTRNITIQNDLTYDNLWAIMIRFGDNQSTMQPSSNVISNNNFIMKDNTQGAYTLSIPNNASFTSTTITSLAAFSNNKLFVPFNYDKFVIRTDKYNANYGEGQRWKDLASWQSEFSQDSGTTISTPAGYTTSSPVNVLTESFATNALAGTLAGSAAFDRRTITVTGGELQTTCTNTSSGLRSTFLIYYGSVNTLVNNNYRIRFTARSASGAFVVNTWLNSYVNGDTMNQFRVTTTPTTIELFFPDRAAATGIGLYFETDDVNGTFYIDDYTIDRVSATYPVPNNELIFLYNDLSTTQNKSYIGGPWKNIITDVNFAASPVSLSAYSSVVGLKTTSTGTNIGKTVGGGIKKKRNVISV